MIKTLQKKFVVSAMAAVTILIAVFMLLINIINIVTVSGRSDMMLEELSVNEIPEINMPEMPDMPEIPMPDKNPQRHFRFREINEDDKLAARFFEVLINSNGEITQVKTEQIASVGTDEAKALALEIIESGKGSGIKDGFKYVIKDDSFTGGGKILFLDITSDIEGIFSVMLISLAVGTVCLLLTLMLVILLSKKAIRPIAENIEKQKRFVTDAGHEIKTPLAIIMANTDAMELYNGETKWSKNIRTQAERLSGLMQNLLVLAKTDEGGKYADASEFCLSELLSEGVEQFAESAKAKKITLESEIEPQVEINFDRQGMARIISILADNAVKYTDEGGRIDVTLKTNGKAAVMRFENTCKALPESEPEKLFDRFYREDGARTQSSGGYGIGLSAAQAIAQANKADIRAEYTDYGTVVFTLILAK